MKTYLVTGAAGFIGANFIKYLLHDKYKDDEIRVIILDALTYAGNLGTIKDDIDGERCVFVKGDIRDRELADKLFSENDIDYVVNFAAESHVDRSIEDPQLFLSVNILGTQNLLDAAKKAWTLGKGDDGYPQWKPGKPPQPIQRIKDGCRPYSDGIPRHIPHAGDNHKVLQQLRTLPFPREAHPAHHQQHP